jgi:phage terminase large subunit-like protein
MSKMLSLNPKLLDKYRLVPSSKTIIGTSKAVEFKALSADAKNQYGGNHRIVLVDELGQTIGPISPLYDSLVTGQGGQANPKMLILSTQAPGDADLLSVIIDTAINSNDGRVAVHLYSAETDCLLDDEAQWTAANPAPFRSWQDIQRQSREAQTIPVTEARFRNLILNQRTSQNNIFVPARLWKELQGASATRQELESYPLHIGLDLSKRTDLTAAVVAFERDNGEVVLKPYVFTPEIGLAEREHLDRAPYQMWVRQGYMIAVPGKTISYDWVAQYLMLELQGCTIATIQFDRWGIEHFKEAAARECLYADEWIPVGQGYKDFAPRLNGFEEGILNGTIAHGNHPVLTMAAVNAISVSDPAGNRKLDKSRTSARIDPLVAAVMAAFPLLDGKKVSFDIGSLVS